jgi:uncharacterized membrane-anchored protein
LEHYIAIVGLLLTEELAEGAITATIAIHSALFTLRAIGIVSQFGLFSTTAQVSGVLICLLAIGVVGGDWRVLIALLDVFSFDVKLAKLSKVIDKVMRNSEPLF